MTHGLRFLILAPVLWFTGAAADAQTHPIERGAEQQRAVDAVTEDDSRTSPLKEPQTDAQPAEPDPALHSAQNRRAMGNCVTARGLSSEQCRQRQPNQGASMSRAQSRNLQDRYRTPGPGSGSKQPSAASTRGGRGYR